MSKNYTEDISQVRFYSEGPHFYIFWKA